MEVLFSLIKNKVDMKGTELFDHTFLFTAYADDSTFFLKYIFSFKMLVETYGKFSFFSRLKPNVAKCEIAGLRPLKAVVEAACGLKTVELTKRS